MLDSQKHALSPGAKVDSLGLLPIPLELFVDLQDQQNTSDQQDVYNKVLLFPPTVFETIGLI